MISNLPWKWLLCWMYNTTVCQCVVVRSTYTHNNAGLLSFNTCSNSEMILFVAYLYTHYLKTCILSVRIYQSSHRCQMLVKDWNIIINIYWNTTNYTLETRSQFIYSVSTVCMNELTMMFTGDNTVLKQLAAHLIQWIEKCTIQSTS